MNLKTINETLSRFFPVEAADKIRELVDTHGFQLKFRRGRASKLGDFRPSVRGKPHQITINSDLNVYTALLILLHEFAHLLVWQQEGRTGQPHGSSWRRTFGELIREFAGYGYFHPTLKETMLIYSWEVKASGIGSEKIMKALQVFDNDDGSTVWLEDLPEQSHFLTRTGRLFRKEEQLRKRYKCYCVDNERTYLFHPMAKVHTVADNKSK